MDEAAMLCDTRYAALCTEPCGQALVALAPDDIVPTTELPFPSLNQVWGGDMAIMIQVPPAAADSHSLGEHVFDGCSGSRARSMELGAQKGLVFPNPAHPVDRGLYRQDHPKV